MNFDTIKINTYLILLNVNNVNNPNIYLYITIHVFLYMYRFFIIFSKINNNLHIDCEICKYLSIVEEKIYIENRNKKQTC